MNTIKLTINKNNLEFTFGLGFLGELLEYLDTDLGGLMASIDKNPFKYVPLTMFESVKYNYDSKGQELTFTKHEFINWIDDAGGLTDKNKEVMKFVTAFRQSLVKDVPVDDEESTDKGGGK